MTRREGAAISQRRHPGFDRPARELGRRPNGYPWGRISATDYRAWFPPGMVEPWRLYSIFEIIMPSRRRGAVPERYLSKLGPVRGHRQERKARRRLASAPGCVSPRVKNAPMKRMGNRVATIWPASHLILHRRRAPLFAVRSFRSMEGLQRRLDVTPDGSEFDLRWVADIRYGLRRWPAGTASANLFRAMVRRRCCKKAAGGQGGLAWLFRPAILLSVCQLRWWRARRSRPSRSIRVIRTGLASN